MGSPAQLLLGKRTSGLSQELELHRTAAPLPLVQPECAWRGLESSHGPWCYSVLQGEAQKEEAIWGSQLQSHICTQ